MYSNFDEIIQNMITPEMNSEEFLKLLLTSEMDPVKGKLMLTKNFNYDLNSNHSEDLSFFVNNVKFKAEIFLKSIEKLPLEIIQENQNGITNKTFISFMKFLSTISPEKYWEMVNLKRDKNVGDENKKKRFIGYYERLLGDKHGFDFDPTSMAWYYFRSYTMSPANNESFHTDDVKHRLYVAINYDQLMRFTTDFISKLEEVNQPYLLKIKSCKPSGKCPENDMLVIYADTEERVLKYVNILNEMIKSNKEYEQSIHIPSSHLGIIDGKIGYGREFGKESSYSGVVGEIADKAIRIALRDVYYGRGQSKDYSKKEMFDVIQHMKISLSSRDVFENFKENFWDEFYKICEQRGYNMDESICVGEREEHKIDRKRN